MDDNLKLLLILLAPAFIVGLVAAFLSSKRIRTYGVIGTLRRRFSGGYGRSPYQS